MAQTGKLTLGLIGSTFIASLLGNISSSQFVIANLNEIGANLSFNDRLSMTLSDIAGFGPLYGVFIFIGFVVAFMAGALIYKFTKINRTLIYSAAGFISMIVMLYMMKNIFFGVQLVAGARGLPGLIMQGIIGSLAGFIFARITAPNRLS